MFKGRIRRGFRDRSRAARFGSAWWPALTARGFCPRPSSPPNRAPRASRASGQTRPYRARRTLAPRKRSTCRPACCSCAADGEQVAGTTGHSSAVSNVAAAADPCAARPSHRGGGAPTYCAPVSSADTVRPAREAGPLLATRRRHAVVRHRVVPFTTVFFLSPDSRPARVRFSSIIIIFFYHRHAPRFYVRFPATAV